MPMSVCRTHRATAIAVLLALASLEPGCSVEPEPSSASSAGLVLDDRGLRARISACVGVEASTAVSYFGPALVEGLPEAAIECVGAARDCREVLGCLGWTPDSCDGIDECRDGKALHCRELGYPILTVRIDDCATDPDGNRECAVIDGGHGAVAMCHHGQCRGDRCEGDVLVQCRASVEAREDCARNGRTCVSGGSGVFCALPESCERDECQGDTIRLCRDGRLHQREDCTKLVANGRCEGQPGSAECVAENWNQNCPRDEPFLSFCDSGGGRALACYLGALYEARCDAFLGGHCELRDRGGARCRVPGWP